jgi:hypothetical protein
MSEPTGKETFAGPRSRSALAQCLGSSATSLILAGKGGVQDGQNGQDKTADPSSRPSCPFLSAVFRPPCPNTFRMKATVSRIAILDALRHEAGRP